jgi:hypothetical protein
MIPLSIVIGIVAVSLGNWLVVAIMALNLGGQSFNLWTSRGRLGKRNPR